MSLSHLCKFVLFLSFENLEMHLRKLQHNGFQQGFVLNALCNKNSPVALVLLERPLWCHCSSKSRLACLDEYFEMGYSKYNVIARGCSLLLIIYIFK